LIDDVIECLEGLVESLLAATVLLVVGLSGNVAKQLFKIVVPGGQHDAVSVIDEAGSKHEPLAGCVDEAEASKRGGDLNRDHHPDVGHRHKLGPAGAEVEYGPFPSPDDALVTAGGAPPLDRRRNIGP